MDNEANIPEDYNNQGVDVIASHRRDAGDCILDDILNEIQNAPLIEATRKAERIGYNTINIVKASNQAKLNIKKNERNPKYINADTIKVDMQNGSRTRDDVNTESSSFPDEFNEYGNEQFGQQFNEQSNEQFGQQFNEQSNEQFGQQFNEQSDEQFEQQTNGKFRQQGNNDWER